MMIFRGFFTDEASYEDIMTPTVYGETTPVPTTLQARYGREYLGDFKALQEATIKINKSPPRLKWTT